MIFRLNKKKKKRTILHGKNLMLKRKWSGTDEEKTRKEGRFFILGIRVG